jgi:hypothetical protein
MMIWRVTLLAAVVLALGTWLVAAAVLKPGEKAKGAEFKSEGYTLVWGSLKTSSEVDLGDEKQSKYTLQLDGTLEAPADQDAVCVYKQLRIQTILDDKGAEIALARKQTLLATNAYYGFHDGVAQVELARTELNRDASRIASIACETDILLAKKRITATLPAVVMEEFKDVGAGVSARITNLTMSTNRELTIILSDKRTDGKVTSPFIERIWAVDPVGKDIGGGRWTQGDPFGVAGTWTAKFKISGTQTHQSFRLDVVTESELKTLKLETKDLFARP